MTWTTPKTWASSEQVAASMLNTHLRDNLDYLKASADVSDAYGVWQDYTPTMGNVTVGDGTLLGRYAQVGNLVAYSVEFTLGSTSAITGIIQVHAPVTPKGDVRFQVNAELKQNGGSVYPTSGALAASTNSNINAMNTSGTYATFSGTSATVPFTWGSGDRVVVTGVYEAA